ncbi:MAG TPA: LysR family transcriptional regulator, partial [Novosphingobium sp.]|nr:LysR family transcriptional regulator [Novosphingobium sp.]
MIEIRQLRAFVTLAETLHFTRAAERLHITQPPLSRQVAGLEQALGVRLFDRHSRAVRLTPAGTRLLADARGLLAGLDQACRNAQAAARGELGELAVGFMMHAAYSSVPALARRFVADWPEVRLTLREILPSAIVGAVMAGELDAGITFTPPPQRGLASAVLAREGLCLAVPAGHGLAAGGGPVGAADLAGVPLV